jgi:hypothetical protein
MVLLFLISSVLIVQTAYCLLVPANYPTAHLEDLRSMENPPTLPPALNESALFSSVQFLDSPINTTQLVEVGLKDINDVEVDWHIDSRLTGNGTVEWIDTLFLPKTDVNNLQVAVDGQNINYYITDLNETKRYTIPGFNLTEVNQVKRLEIHFGFVRLAFHYSFVEIPWIFNDNYVEFVNFPVMSIPLEMNSTSDENTFKITFDLPFREILINQSGWVDGFVLPKNESQLVNSTYRIYNVEFLEYPIVQEREVYGNTYSFTTHFSGKNIANLVQMVIIPSWSIPAFLLLFLAAPFYICVWELVRNRLEEKSENGKDSKKITLGKTVKLLLQLYGGPLAFVIYFILGGVSIPLFSYLVDVVVWNYLGMTLILLYPVIFYFVVYKFKASALN